MASEKLNLYQKIIEVRKSIGKITKDSTAGKGSKFSYDYVSGSLILSKIKEEMNNQRLLFTPLIKDKNYKQIDTTNRYGKPETNYIVELDLSYKWINADNPEETLEIPFYAIGEQSDPSKAFGTALTYSERYVLLKMFNLPTDEDDADAKEINKPQKRTPKQDDGKLQLVKTNADVLAKILTSKGDEKTSDDIIKAYTKGYNINNFTNEQLTQLADRIKAKVEQYKKEDNKN